MKVTSEDVLTTHNCLREAQTERRQTVSLYTVNRYCGDVNSDGRFDGMGDMESSMGYTYSGMFRDGQLEGPGRMTWRNDYCIECMFVGGAANGIGKITWPNGDRYEGMLHNNFRHGEGTLTSKKGRAVYRGASRNGKREGYGVQSYEDGSIYRGYWFHDKRHGRGVLQYSSGDCYSGEWHNDTRHGRGSMGWRSGREGLYFDEVYDGEWVNGRPHGQGICTYIFMPVTLSGGDARRADTACEDNTNGTTHVSDVDNPFGRRPIESAPDARVGGDKNTSERGNDVDHRRSTSCVPTLDLEEPSSYAPPASVFLNVYRGQYRDGLRHGYGIFYYADGSNFRGQWKHGAKCEHQGIFINSAGIASTVMCSGGDENSTRRECDATSAGCTLAVPKLYVADLRGINDSSCDVFLDGITALFMRVNTTLKELFYTYTHKCKDVALINTQANWWRHRLPGHIAIPQLLRLLSDKCILQGSVTAATALTCVAQTIYAERGVALKSQFLALDRVMDDFAVESNRSASRTDLSVAECPQKNDENDDVLVAQCSSSGSLNYRQFGETIVRLAPYVCVGECYPTLKDKFTALVETYLQCKSEDRPLYPMTRRYQSMVSSYIADLKEKFLSLAQYERRWYDEDKTQKQLFADATYFVHARTVVVRLVNHVTDYYSMSLLPTLSDLFSCLRISPDELSSFPGINHPTSAIAATLISQGCGKENVRLISCTLSHHQLTFVDFVEIIVTLSALISHKRNASIQETIRRILSFVETD